ncbi:prolyl oligopeptidase family serine peptidase [Treponema sp.]|uniref:prolyl oligopeptidase family serine peptidase n=1 Tax=Treponema sp. TaxID=166 RepID=UPI00388F9603
MKKIISFIVFTLFSSLSFAQLFQESLEPAVNQSVVYVGSYDWGACIEKIVINTGHDIQNDKIKSENFTVERILYPKGTSIGMQKGELTVTDAFLSDSKGNKTEENSSYITILTDVYPDAENSSPFVSMLLGDRFYNYYGYKITNKALSISITNLKGFVNKDAAKFNISKFEYIFPATAEEKADPKYEEKTLTLPYASFIPETKKKIPLILWFHGMGESGTNAYQVLFGTKSSAFATETIQKYFKDGVAVLAPQCPTGWLETTEESSFGIRYWAPVDKDAPINTITKPLSNFLGNFFTIDDSHKTEKTPFAAVSYYTEPVKTLLFRFLAEHPEIDRDRIYVGGCSAGGYMTMNMFLECTEIFAAAFPVCEYYLDSKITDSQISKIAEKPIWFTYALNDETVNPQKTAVPTIKRLKEAGAKNLHVSEFRNVVDLSGKILLKRDAGKDDSEYGLPYEYDGHSSWIYVFNDRCRDGDLSLFDWLSKQKL